MGLTLFEQFPIYFWAYLCVYFLYLLVLWALMTSLCMFAVQLLNSYLCVKYEQSIDINLFLPFFFWFYLIFLVANDESFLVDKMPFLFDFSIYISFFLNLGTEILKTVHLTVSSSIHYTFCFGFFGCWFFVYNYC